MGSTCAGCQTGRVSETGGGPSAKRFVDDLENQSYFRCVSGNENSAMMAGPLRRDRSVRHPWPLHCSTTPDRNFRVLSTAFDMSDSRTIGVIQPFTLLEPPWPLECKSALLRTLRGKVGLVGARRNARDSNTAPARHFLPVRCGRHSFQYAMCEAEGLPDGLPQTVEPRIAIGPEGVLQSLPELSVCQTPVGYVLLKPL